MSDTPPILSLVDNRHALAATLELVFLQKTLMDLPSERKTAIDVGAHRGDMTTALADLGFRVLAVEPQPPIYRHLTERFLALREAGIVLVQQCAASDRHGIATMLVGSASTVSTLEESWTKVAFPEEFSAPRKVKVPVCPVGELASAHDFKQPGFVKIDVEGHELPALRGLFQGQLADDPPPLVMFEANQRFAGAAEDCLLLLAARGYNRFDIFIREGIAPIAAERFTRPAIPEAWSRCEGKYFYANIIAYHSSLTDEMLPGDPAAFVGEYQMNAARIQLARMLEAEAHQPIPIHPIWANARRKLRDYLLEADWRDFLRHPVCKGMFFRGRWGAAQDLEHKALLASQFGRDLLERVRDPRLGSPRLSERLPDLSTNLLGMLYYLARVQDAGPTGTSRGLPDRVVEVGGGYGAFAYAYGQSRPDVAYAIVDLPEMLAIQHYFLTQALPGHRIVCATDAASVKPAPRTILLVPVSLIGAESLETDLFFSTFGFSEMPRELQSRIEETNYFGAGRIFLAGQYSTEFPQIQLVDHGKVIDAARERFSAVKVERFHSGDNYLLIGSKSAAA